MCSTLTTVFFLLSLIIGTSLQQEVKEADMVLNILKHRIPTKIALPNTPKTQILHGWANMELRTVRMNGFRHIKVLKATIESYTGRSILVMTIRYNDLTVDASYYHLALFRGVTTVTPKPVDNLLAMTLILDDSSCSIEVDHVSVIELGDIYFNMKEMCTFCKFVPVRGNEASNVNEFVRDLVYHQLTSVVSTVLRNSDIDRTIYDRCTPVRRSYVVDGKELLLDLIAARRDGACLFNTLSIGMYGTQDQAQDVRNEVVDYIVANFNHYSGFLSHHTDDRLMTAEEYFEYMRKPQVFGTSVEINAASDLYKRRIIVFREGVVYSDVGEHEWPSIMSEFSGSPDEGHFDLLIPTV